MLDEKDSEFRLTERGWMWCGQVVARPGQELRPVVAMIARLSGRRITGWEQDGDVVRVKTSRRRPCRRSR